MGNGYEVFDGTLSELGLSERVVRTGFVPDEVRSAIIARAVALAYPSIFEGFGLPILEAMQAGTPVLTSNRTAMPGVAGDAAILVDPFDVDDIAKGIRLLLTDADLREDLRQKGFEQAARFSVTATGEAALAAFERGRQLGPPPGGRQIGA